MIELALVWSGLHLSGEMELLLLAVAFCVDLVSELQILNINFNLSKLFVIRLHFFVVKDGFKCIEEFS